MLTRQLDKSYRADLTFFRNSEEVFTCGNEKAKAISLNDYNLVFSVFNPQDALATPVLEKIAIQETERQGRFTITNNNETDDYSSMQNDKYTYQITRRNKNNNANILMQYGTLSITNIDKNG